MTTKRGLLEDIAPSTNIPNNSKSIESLKTSFINHLTISLAKDKDSATAWDRYKSLVFTVKDLLAAKWVKTRETYYKRDARRIYYISLEFLIGRSLGNALINLGIYNETSQALQELGYDLEDILETELDPGFGNAGLGRLAACFIDSMATLELPGYGYGIRYEYGIFEQKIKDGYQVECPDNWLSHGNPWEIARPEYSYSVKFHGKAHEYMDKDGICRTNWVGTQEAIAIAYDTPIPGYHNNTVNTLRLWAAKSPIEFDFSHFSYGNYAKAVWDKIHTETISRVLYPPDNIIEGQELRLKQEYFCVSATLQDIIRRYKKEHRGRLRFFKFHKKVAIQINDTHPAIGIAELMRLLVDVEGIKWGRAWEITLNTFAYTNHTVLLEALERWPVSLLERVLPRHLQIIYKINHRFLGNVNKFYPNDMDRLRRMSIIEEGEEKLIRMAHLAIVGSHAVNGVSILHTEILKKKLFKDFCDIWPERFNNKTNGITQRRWLRLCNPLLSALISENIGENWIIDLSELKKLIHLVSNTAFQERWKEVKLKNKIALAIYIKEHNHIEVNMNSIFDCHVKRFHEYKRQLMNALHIISLYNRIKAEPDGDLVPRTFIFAGKAAPNYYMAKLIIKLINSIADIINNDSDIGERLKVVFIENYSVSLAEKIFPAVELSEQISTAGFEASGTGNMKAALNGALTIGTLDGANIEIRDEVGAENIFIFGLTTEDVTNLRQSGYNPWDYYHKNPELKQVIDMINNGYFSRSQPHLFNPIVDSLLDDGDYYMVLADFEAYVRCQQRVSEAYKNQKEWTMKSILNVANMGRFSSTNTIQKYATEIWGVKPIPINMANNG